MKVTNDNFDLRKNAPLDNRELAIDEAANLPDPNTTPFLYEGMIKYTILEKTNWQLQADTIIPGDFTWVDIGGATTPELVVGTITISSAQTTIDMVGCIPPIETCHSVIIEITDGTEATINLIENFPGDDKLITFYTEVGNTITFIHSEYDTPGSDTITFEDSFNFELNGRTEGNESITLKLHDTKICQHSAIQFLKRDELTDLLQNFSPYDGLDSSLTTRSLSANQGRILNDKVNTKQNAFINGNHLEFSGATQPFTLESLPYNFTVIANNTSLSSAVNAAHTAGIDPNFFRVYYSQSEGTWILAPRVASKNAFNLSGHNWLKIADGFDQPLACKFNIYPDAALNVAAGTTYYIKIDNSTRIGDNIPAGYNTDGSSTIKVNTRLLDGLFLVKAKLNVTTSVARKLQLKLFTTDALGSNVTPLNGASVLQDKQYESSTTAESITLEVETLIQTSAGNSDVITLQLVTDLDFTTCSFETPYCGFLEIQKLKSLIPPPPESA